MSAQTLVMYVVGNTWQARRLPNEDALAFRLHALSQYSSLFDWPISHDVPQEFDDKDDPLVVRMSYYPSAHELPVAGLPLDEFSPTPPCPPSHGIPVTD